MQRVLVPDHSRIVAPRRSRSRGRIEVSRGAASGRLVSCHALPRLSRHADFTILVASTGRAATELCIGVL
jgi:hypothetical protein